MKVNRVMFFKNGMVCVFDEKGRQVAALQGYLTAPLFRKIMNAVRKETHFEDYREDDDR